MESPLERLKPEPPAEGSLNHDWKFQTDPAVKEPFTGGASMSTGMPMSPKGLACWTPKRTIGLPTQRVPFPKLVWAWDPE